MGLSHTDQTIASFARTLTPVCSFDTAALPTRKGWMKGGEHGVSSLRSRGTATAPLAGIEVSSDCKPPRAHLCGPTLLKALPKVWEEK